MKLQPFADEVWIAWAHQTFLGLHVGARMTVVRLPDGSLWVHSPLTLAGLRDQVDALGEVRHIVCPNNFHHLYAAQWAAAYPSARVHGPQQLRRKRPDLRIDADLGDVDPEWSDALVPIAIDGSLIYETVFVHPATRTVISADLVENFTECNHWFTRLYLKASGLDGQPGWSRLARFLYRDRRATRRSVDRLLEHDFDRLIVAHGDLFDSEGPDAVRHTFRFLG